MRWLLLVGTLCMSFTVFTRSILPVSENVEDFFKGFGIVLVISAIFWKQKKQPLSEVTSNKKQLNSK